MDRACSATATHVYVGFQSNGFVTIGGEPFLGPEHLLAIPRSEFPEFDEDAGIDVIGYPWDRLPDETVASIRAAYLTAITRTHPA